MKLKTICAIVTMLISGASQAAVIVIAPGGSTPGTMTIAEEITFTVTISTTVRYLVLDEWVTSDIGATPASISPNLEISINGGPSSTYSALLIDNASNAGDITPNDGHILLPGGFTVAANDSVTLHLGTYVLTPFTTGFNPQATQSFAGNMFLADGNSTRVSDVVQVPEPSATTLSALVLGVGLFYRRRNEN